MYVICFVISAPSLMYVQYKICTRTNVHNETKANSTRLQHSEN